MRRAVLQRLSSPAGLVAGTSVNLAGAAMALVASLVLAPVALADASHSANPSPYAAHDANHSANWSGYAVHRAGVRFRRATATWVQPSASCTPGQRSYSAFWVGLGGYSRTATALEQIGTEVDCAASGAIRSTAWYELVPAASRPIHLNVRPGDRIDATVTVDGRRVSVSLHDVTTARWFRKKLTAALVDITSAEWIAEAPSVCVDATSCETLPLADFGSARFTRARAVTTGGHAGSIADRHWGRTKISLLPAGSRLAVAEPVGILAGESRPSPLEGNGSTFTVTYSRLAVSGSQFARARAASSPGGELVH